jgi:hypothetical protein
MFPPESPPPRGPRQEPKLELPTSHRVPVTWIRDNACASIRWRTVTEILPPGSATQGDIDALQQELMSFKRVVQTLKKQKGDGLWAGNVLGIAPAKAQGIKDVGTVAQYRHLLELGVPRDERALRLADRLFYRVLSRDTDPGLLFEYRKAAKTNVQVVGWARNMMREGATAALAQAGQAEDPRVRGSAHRIASQMSQFLRSELAEKPVVRKGARYLLQSDAYPPTVFSVAMVAFMPALQRERAGFADRLGIFLAQPAPKRAYSIQLGRKVIKPVFHVLGDPLHADSAGNPADLPFALHWMELLARLGMLDQSATAQRILARLQKDCDDDGVWNPKNLRAIPRSPSGLADFAFPLELDGRTAERRKADVTFRLALIARLADRDLDFVT